MVLVEEGMRRTMRPDGIILAPTVSTGVPHLLLKGVDSRSYIFDESGRMLTDGLKKRNPLDEDENPLEKACIMRIDGALR